MPDTLRCRLNWTKRRATVVSGSGSSNNARLSLLIERAGATLPIPECDLSAKGVIDNNQKGLTFTCAPWGSSVRMGIDFDLDGIRGGNEVSDAFRHSTSVTS